MTRSFNYRKDWISFDGSLQDSVRIWCHWFGFSNDIAQILESIIAVEIVEDFAFVDCVDKQVLQEYLGIADFEALRKACLLTPGLSCGGLFSDASEKPCNDHGGEVPKSVLLDPFSDRRDGTLSQDEGEDGEILLEDMGSMLKLLCAPPTLGSHAPSLLGTLVTATDDALAPPGISPPVPPRKEAPRRPSSTSPILIPQKASHASPRSEANTHELYRVAEEMYCPRERCAVIEEKHREIVRNATLDVAILIDWTKSMSPYVEDLKAKMGSFVKSSSYLHPYLQLRLAVVAYRDHCDNAHRICVLPFTEDVDRCQEFVGSLEANGGAEDVMGGLEATLGLDWRSAVRCLYHIVPCHGATFHLEDLGDDYSNGDPTGLVPEHVLPQLRQLGIQYYFGRIISHTDLMITQFTTIMSSSIADGGEGQQFFVTESQIEQCCVADSLIRSVAESVTASLISSTSRAMSTYVELKTKVALATKAPNWSALPCVIASYYPMTQPTSLQAFLHETDDRCVSDFPSPTKTSFKKALHGFALGDQRVAFMAMDESSGEPFVLKESLAVRTKHRSKRYHEQIVVCHRAALFLAREFDFVRPIGCPRVSFVNVGILQTRPEEAFYIREPVIGGASPGSFEKFNNNSGFCAPNPSLRGTDHRAVQAFSHWTHHISSGKALVVDCQGVFNHAMQCFELTNPAVHSTDESRFGPTNLGEIGIVCFFATHICNDFCHALGLK